VKEQKAYAFSHNIFGRGNEVKLIEQSIVSGIYHCNTKQIFRPLQINLRTVPGNYWVKKRKLKK